MENAESALKTRLKQLERAEEKADQVLKGGKQSVIQRHLTNLKELITEADNARRSVEALKIDAKVNDGDINEWNDAMNAKIEEADSHIETLDAKVRKSVEALPHSAEGYNRAVSILKDRFGKQSEIVKAYVKEILELPYTSTGKTKRIHEFFDKLSHSVQSLETLKSLHEVNGMVSLTLEKLPIIREDLVRNDPDWETWDFVKFTEALRQWTRRNPIDSFKLEDSQSFRKRDRVFQTQQNGKRARKCVYCQAEVHKPSECTKITSPTDRKEFLATKRLCYNW